MGKEDSDTDGAGVLDRAPEPPALHEEDERTNVLSVWVGHETLRRDRLALSCQRRRRVEVGTGVGTAPAAAATATRPTEATKRCPHTRADEHAPGRNRTCDLVLRRHALYPLSYGRQSA